jgi:hypothetical protein
MGSWVQLVLSCLQPPSAVPHDCVCGNGTTLQHAAVACFAAFAAFAAIVDFNTSSTLHWSKGVPG